MFIDERGTDHLIKSGTISFSVVAYLINEHCTFLVSQQEHEVSIKEKLKDEHKNFIKQHQIFFCR